MFTASEKEMLAAGLALYRAKLKKIMKQAEGIEGVESESKRRFLEAEALSGKLAGKL